MNVGDPVFEGAREGDAGAGKDSPIGAPRRARLAGRPQEPGHPSSCKGQLPGVRRQD
jgi:hypothetical protein